SAGPPMAPPNSARCSGEPARPSRPRTRGSLVVCSYATTYYILSGGSLHNPALRNRRQSHMRFRPGHAKQGGRRSGANNKLTGEARAVARRLLGDAAYQRSLQKRLIRGEAPRLEVHLWELPYGRPRVEPETAPEAGGASASLAQILEK